MPVHFGRAFAAAALIVGALSPVQSAASQSAAASGAQEAESQPPGVSAAARDPATPGRRGRHSRTQASPVMRTGESPVPTGPNTSTVQPDTSDLSGSNGASITQSLGVAPPGVSPPNGSAPDTGGGAAVDNVPSSEGGPH